MTIVRKDYPSTKWIKDYVVKDLVAKGMNGMSANDVVILNIDELNQDDFKALISDAE